MNNQALKPVRKLSSTRIGFVFGFMSLVFCTSCTNTGDDSHLNDSTRSVEENSSPQGIEFFDGTFEDALTHAAKENKKVFVDFWATWCGPCIVVQETVFPLQEVGDYMNPKFVSLKIDVENKNQNGPDISARYGIGVLPTYLILDSDGNELSRSISAVAPRQFVAMVSRMLGETESSFDEMQARYENGERSREFLRQYLMDAIVELGFRELDNTDEESMRAFREEGSKYSEIANEYFASVSHSNLINETDVRLIMHFRGSAERGDELVEYVIANYEKFLVVSSVSAMSQFVLKATQGSVADLARAGDERFTEYIDALETEPLKHATDYERSRDPSSRMLPERLKSSWEPDFLVAREDWDGVYELYKGRFEDWGDRTSAGNFSWAASTLIQSNDPDHQQAALEWATRAFDMNNTDWSIVATYVSALVTNDKIDEARQAAEDYRSRLTDSASDQRNLEIFNDMTSSLLEGEKSESAQSQ